MKILFFVGIIGMVVSFATAVLIFFYYDIISCIKDLRGYQTTTAVSRAIPTIQEESPKSKSAELREKLKNVPIENPELTLVLNDISMEMDTGETGPNDVTMENINTDQTGVLEGNGLAGSEVDHTGVLEQSYDEPVIVRTDHTEVLESNYDKPIVDNDSHTGVLEQNYNNYKEPNTDHTGVLEKSAATVGDDYTGVLERSESTSTIADNTGVLEQSYDQTTIVDDDQTGVLEQYSEVVAVGDDHTGVLEMTEHETMSTSDDQTGVLEQNVEPVTIETEHTGVLEEYEEPMPVSRNHTGVLEQQNSYVSAIDLDNTVVLEDPVTVRDFRTVEKG